jgi:hypothetical protein
MVPQALSQFPAANAHRGKRQIFSALQKTCRLFVIRAPDAPAVPQAIARHQD